MEEGILSLWSKGGGSSIGQEYVDSDILSRAQSSFWPLLSLHLAILDGKTSPFRANSATLT